MSNIFDRIAAAISEPARPFLVTPSGQTITYGDLDGLTAHYANALVAAGVAVGDRVAVQVEKSPEALILYLATVRAGAVFLPLNTAYTLSELEYFIGDAEPSVVVGRPETGEALQNLCATIGSKAKVLTLGTKSDGTLADSAQSASA